MKQKGVSTVVLVAASIIVAVVVVPVVAVIVFRDGGGGSSGSSNATKTIDNTIRIVVDIPDYSHSENDNYDLIQIPNGRLGNAEGYPIVPYLMEEFSMPFYESPAEVNLVAAENVVILENINLPIVQYQSSVPVPEVEYQFSGDFPGFFHSMSLYTEYYTQEKRVVVHVMPLQYNKTKGEARLYKHIEIEINTVFSFLQVTGPLCWQPVGPLSPGDNISQSFHLKNLDNATISEVNIGAEGEIKDWVSFSTTKFTSLAPGEERELAATINLPLQASPPSAAHQYRGNITLTSGFRTQIIPVYLWVYPLPEAP